MKRKISYPKINSILYRIFIIIMILYSVTAIVIYLFLVPKNPLFLRHRLDVQMPVQDDSYYNYDVSDDFILTYICSAKEERYIRNIVFDEAESMTMYVQEYTNHSYFLPSLEENNPFVPYKVKKVQLLIDKLSISDQNNPLSLEHATIEMSDGSSYHTSLGKIVLYPSQENNDTIRMTSGSSSMSMIYSHDYEVTEPVVITGVKSWIEDDQNLDYELLYQKSEISSRKDSIHDSYKKNQIFTVGCEYKRSTNDSVYDSYMIAPYIEYENTDGSIGKAQLPQMDHNRDFESVFDILSYLWKRGVN